MFHKVISVTPSKDYILNVCFIDGLIKKYDVKPLFKQIKRFNKLKNINLFNKVYVGQDGYGVIWNEEIDLSCDELYNNGTKV